MPDHHVVAIDQSGRTVVANNGSWSSTSGLLSGQFTVALPAANIKELRYETRPFDQWIEIDNVSIDPSKPTEPKVTASDDPPQGL
jgi:hypothetical protein